MVLFTLMRIIFIYLAVSVYVCDCTRILLFRPKTAKHERSFSHLTHTDTHMSRLIIIYSVNPTDKHLIQIYIVLRDKMSLLLLCTTILVKCSHLKTLVWMCFENWNSLDESFNYTWNNNQLRCVSQKWKFFSFREKNQTVSFFILNQLF